MREAQRHLRYKERSFAPLAYIVFIVAGLVIFSAAYTSYAFSKYRGVILPGVYVDRVYVGGMTTSRATRTILAQLKAIYYRPMRLHYGTDSWAPKDVEIGLSYEVEPTVVLAEGIGRKGGFLRDLIDRLPLHPTHHLPMLYATNPTTMGTYLQAIGRKIRAPEVDAYLKMQPNGVVALVPSRPGLRLNIAGTEKAIALALGHLSRQTVPLAVDQLPPVINDQAALRVKARVDRFLNAPPTITVGKLKVTTSRTDFAPMISFSHKVTGKHTAVIQMNVIPSAVHAYIAQLATSVDRPAVDPRYSYDLGHVRVIRHQRAGRVLQRQAAYTALLGAITGLKPNSHLVFNVRITHPPVNPTNPATMGITTLLAEGQTSFQGAGSARLQAIQTILNQLDGDLLSPNQQVSFNTLLGTGWDPSVYQDQEQQKGGKLVPGPHGAMQQVATTFLRALFQAGLKLNERHAHTYLLPWYSPPVGLDAVVSPDRNWDLVFTNNTGKYLLLRTHVEPVRQVAYIYVYGPKLGWSVSVDPVGKVLKVIPHGPTIVRSDDALPPGETQQIQWPHNGARTVVTRTITYRSGKVVTNSLYTTYIPWQGIVLQGSTPKPTATPAKGSRSGARATPGPTPTAPAPPAPPTPGEHG